jgi:acyl phosphate:glycerol-3-phosphate acyltransferase
MVTSLLIALVAGYLLGSLPFGYWIARSRGVNIFEVGSRNPGATNVRRVLGSGPGNLVFGLDALKGALATVWPLVLATWSRNTRESSSSFNFLSASGDPWAAQVAIAGLIGALLGHSFSCFTGFRGGKGVATATGGLVVLMPLAVAVGAVVWTAAFYSSRYVSLASILAALSMPISAFFFREPRVLQGLTLLIGVLVLVRHRTNIQRLLNGTENKFVKKSAAPKT